MTKHVQYRERDLRDLLSCSTKFQFHPWIKIVQDAQDVEASKQGRFKSKNSQYSHSASQFLYTADDTVTPQETNEVVNVSNSSQEEMKDDQELKQHPEISADRSVEANLDNP